MKTYSDDAITHAYMNEAISQEVLAAKKDAVGHASWLDGKQTEQINKLRVWLTLSFVVNITLTLVLHYL
jgi:hypothetical protein